jgi:hypothetical protein
MLTFLMIWCTIGMVLDILFCDDEEVEQRMRDKGFSTTHMVLAHIAFVLIGPAYGVLGIISGIQRRWQKHGEDR